MGHLSEKPLTKRSIKNPDLYLNTKLGKILFDRGQSAYDFAEYAKIDVVTIYKALNGKKIRKDTAKRLVRVTKKMLSMEDFGYETKKAQP